MTFQSDGKLLLGGYFGKYNNTTRNKLARVFAGASSGGGGSLKLLAPNGGESLATGSTSTIQWEAPAAAVTFDLQYSIDNGTTWKPVATGVTGTSYDWDVPLMPGNKTKAKVRITAYNGSHSKTGTDVSDGPFTIEVVHLGAPDGGETWHSGSTATITWETNATVRPVASVKVQYTRDGGTTWKVAGTTSGNPGTLDWTVPAVPAAKTRCKVKVILLDSAGLSVGKDLGDDWFTIAP